MNEVMDAGLRTIVAMKSLRTLDIGDPLRKGRVTNAGLKELARLNSLTSLTLGGTELRQGLKHLASFESLRR